MGSPHVPETLTVAFTTLHLPTLLFVTALVVAFTGTLLVMARGPKDGTSALAVWGVAMMIGALGLVVAAAGESVPWVSGGIDTTLFLGATALSWTGSRVFGGRAALPLVALAGPGLWLAVTPFRGASPAWLLIACVLGAGYTFATAYELWRNRAEHLPSRGPAIGLLIVHGVLYTGRAAGTIWRSDLAAVAEPVIVALVMETLLHTVGLAFLVLAMMKERAELQSSQQLRQLTLQDGLTGIGNRRYFDEQLETEIRRAARNGTVLALLILDVDHFKAFNDAFGHQHGDVCLRAVARTIATFVRRPGDIAARYGGEEFAVLLTNTDPAGALLVAESIRAGVEGMGIAHHGKTHGVVTISIGVGVLTARREWEVRDGLAKVKLIEDADKAMYAAKAAGRNRVRAAWQGAAGVPVLQGSGAAAQGG